MEEEAEISMGHMHLNVRKDCIVPHMQLEGGKKTLQCMCICSTAHTAARSKESIELGIYVQ
jgi:hypothetical protein